VTERRAASSGAQGCGCFVAGAGFLIAAALLSVAVLWGWRSFTVVSSWERTSGLVVDLVDSTDGDTHAPVVAYDPGPGDDRRFEHNVFSANARIGDTVDVVFNPDDPSEAVIYSLVGFWLGPAFLLAGGLLTVIVTMGGVAASRRRGRTAATAAPVRGDTRAAEFRRVETDIDAKGTFSWRIIARGDDGEEYSSPWLDEDPQMALMERGYGVVLVPTDQGWVVEAT